MTDPLRPVSKIWQAAIRVRHGQSLIEGELMGYGKTPEAAIKDAKDVATYRKETILEGKPRLREIEDIKQPFNPESEN